MKKILMVTLLSLSTALAAQVRTEVVIKREALDRCTMVQLEMHSGDKRVIWKTDRSTEAAIEGTGPVKVGLTCYRGPDVIGIAAMFLTSSERLMIGDGPSNSWQNFAGTVPAISHTGLY